MELIIHDFELFYDTIQTLTKFTSSLKLSFTKNGMKCAIKSDERDESRLDLISNSVTVGSEEPVSMCTTEIKTIAQILYRIIKGHTNKKVKTSQKPDYSDVHISFTSTRISIKSNLIKTSLSLVKESAVFVPDDKNFDNLTPIMDVEADINDLKEIMSSTICFRDTKKITVDICKQEDMIKNNVYASLEDATDEHSPSFYTKFGNITFGDVTRPITIDINRIQVFTYFQLEKFKITFFNEPCLMSKFSINSDSGFSTRYRLITKYIQKTLVV